MHMRKSKKFGFEGDRVPRKPLRTSAEMAEEFGIPHRSLVSAMNVDPAGPRPEAGVRTAATGAHWYRPELVRSWWSKRQDRAAVAGSASQAERA